MAGISVTKDTLDFQAGETVVALRDAYVLVQRMAAFISDQQATEDSDPLVDTYGYTKDEAYMLRMVFENLDASYEDIADVMQIARKLTGLR